ncbi:MAG: CDP-glycerol glycerophosphotransferase family protein [Candidatus Cryptobacteroides sp.]
MAKFLKYLLSYLIYPLSFLFHKRKGRLSFGCPRAQFDGNPKYLFLEYSEKGYDCCWLSSDKELIKRLKFKGLKAEYTFSPRGILRALTSSYWIVGAYSSDILWCLSGGAKILNLWHGVALKQIEFCIESGPLADRYLRKTFKERFYHPEVFRRPDLLLASSEEQKEKFCKAFRIPAEHCIIGTYPRNEILLCGEAEREGFIRKYEDGEGIWELACRLKDFKKVYVYMPTWRDDGSSAMGAFDFKAVDKVLQERQEALLVKDHFNFKGDSSYQEGNVFHLGAGCDIYPLLPYTDVLITDYSSVIYDYILMERKNCILYLFDYEEYVSSRNFFYPFEESVVGTKVYDFEALLDLLKGGIPPLDEEKRQELIDKFWTQKHYDFDNYLHI